MRPLAILLLAVTPALAACHRHNDGNLTARVEALEAQYHSQARRLKTLEAEVDALKRDKGAPVVDLTKKDDGAKPAPAPKAQP